MGVLILRALLFGVYTRAPDFGKLLYHRWFLSHALHVLHEFRNDYRGLEAVRHVICSRESVLSGVAVGSHSGL